MFILYCLGWPETPGLSVGSCLSSNPEELGLQARVTTPGSKHIVECVPANLPIYDQIHLSGTEEALVSKLLSDCVLLTQVHAC